MRMTNIEFCWDILPHNLHPFPKTREKKKNDFFCVYPSGNERYRILFRCSAATWSLSSIKPNILNPITLFPKTSKEKKEKEWFKTKEEKIMIF